MEAAGQFFVNISWPLLRLLLGLSAGLLLAMVLEALSWTRHLARLSAPLARIAHFGPCSRTSFALAFVSPASANALLAENYESKSISLFELILANLVNGLPAWLLHIPTIFFLSWPVLGFAAFIYAGLTLAAAVFRTLLVIIAGRYFLPPPDETSKNMVENTSKKAFIKILKITYEKFKKRVIKLICYTAPVYIIIAYGQEAGVFHYLQLWLTRNLAWLDMLKPQAMSIVILQILAETGTALGAAAAVLEEGALSSNDVVIAMLVGSVLATPIRAVRHQLPIYAGFYKMKTAIQLIVINQFTRAFAMIMIIFAYTCAIKG